MKFDEKNQLFFLIALPMILGIIFAIYPQNKQILDLWTEINVAYKQKDFKHYLSTYESILVLQPWRSKDWLSIARASFALQAWQDVIEGYQKVSDQGNMTLEDDYQLAQAYWELGEKEQARNVWAKIRDREEITIDDIQKLVDIQQSHQDFYQAYQTLLTWRARFPQDNSLYYSLGLSQLLYDPENAQQSLIRSLETNPARIDQVRDFQAELPAIMAEKDAVIRLMMSGSLFSRQNEWAYAAGAYAIVLRSIPDYPEAWALYGNALYYLGKDGSEYIRRAYTLDPQSLVVNAMWGYANRRAGEYKQAIEIFEFLGQKESHNALWTYEIAQTYVVMGEFDIALNFFQQAALVDEEEPYYWEALARFCVENSIELETIGVDAARRALTIKPQDGLLNDLMGWIFFTTGDLVSAERFLLKAKHYSPYAAIVHLHLGQLYLKMDQFPLAQEFLQESIQLTENSQIKQQALYLLENYPRN